MVKGGKKGKKRALTAMHHLAETFGYEGKDKDNMIRESMDELMRSGKGKGSKSKGKSNLMRVWGLNGEKLGSLVKESRSCKMF